MLEARSVAVVGASDRPGSFGCLAVDALVLPARAGRTDAAPSA
jgi:acyl-CoA synthetase (NDP forming)